LAWRCLAPFLTKREQFHLNIIGQLIIVGREGAQTLSIRWSGCSRPALNAYCFRWPVGPSVQSDTSQSVFGLDANRYALLPELLRGDPVLDQISSHASERQQ
jgi:hypothetical protein